MVLILECTSKLFSFFEHLHFYTLLLYQEKVSGKDIAIDYSLFQPPDGRICPKRLGCTTERWCPYTRYTHRQIDVHSSAALLSWINDSSILGNSTPFWVSLIWFEQRICCSDPLTEHINISWSAFKIYKFWVFTLWI